MTPVAIEGMTLELSAKSGVVDDGWSASIVTPANDNMKVDESSVYAGDVSVTLSGVSTNNKAITFVPFVITIKAGAKYNKLDKQALVLEGDSGTVSAPGVIVESETPTTDTFTLKVSNAGQNAVKAE